ncbi:MAG: CPBP family intramembrane glutamic endopeptidase [Desulfobacterales bacterium]|nr:CPBP family intramembrane glutamic endopeptidase [Desulfobacterales bacterium]
MRIKRCVQSDGGKKIKTSTVIAAIPAVVVVEFTARLLISQNVPAHMIALGLARIAQIILLLIIAKVCEKSLATVGLASSRAYQGLKKGLIWSVLFGVVAGIVLLVIHLTGIHISGLFRMPLPPESNQLLAFFLVGVLIGPVAEEIFFRGILYTFFRRWGVPTAAVLSTLLFVLPHSYASGSIMPVTQLIGGLLFAIAYEVEKNLLVPIIIHCLGNLAIFTLALMV